MDNNINTPDMCVFCGSGFDIQRPNSLGQILTIQLDANDELFGDEIPRLNKPQVLGDYSFIESLDGFVWDAKIIHDDEYINTDIDLCNHTTKDLQEVENDCFLWISFKGVRQGSIYEAWARQNEIPVINYDGEVV